MMAGFSIEGFASTKLNHPSRKGGELMNVSDPLVTALVVLGILIVIFLVFREVVCWYWKINRMVQLLESIEALLNSQVRPE